MLKRWFGNFYSTSERNSIKRLTRYEQKLVLAAMLVGKSMPSNTAVKTNHSNLLKNKSTLKYLP